MENSNHEEPKGLDATKVFPSRFEIMAVSDLIEENCAKIINDYNECSSKSENQDPGACAHISKQLYVCTEQQIDLAQNTCPIQYSDLLTCLQNNDNQPGSCTEFFDSFYKCMKNM